jgi:D-3-phosphoglycerate dehydrogenase
MDKGQTLGAVNVPEISIPRNLKKNTSRVVSFHDNVPGVLRDINSILSGANITSQRLETAQHIG